MTILEMPVRLYSSPDQLASGTPEWTGSLDEFWSVNQHGYTWGEMRALADELTSTGYHHGGGGAEAEFWLVRGEAAAPKGWDVAETSDLVAALEKCIPGLESLADQDRAGWQPILQDARAAIARAKHGRG
jgi:hypothetical protein